VQPDTANLQALGSACRRCADEHDRSGAQRALRGRLHVQQDPAAAGDGYATSYDEELVGDRGWIRHHYHGLFQFGAPDVVVVNAPRMRSGHARRGSRRRQHGPSSPKGVHLFDLSPTNLEVEFPNPRHTVADMQEPAVRDREIDPKKYYPPDLYREPQPNFPKDFTIDVRELAAKRVRHMQQKLAAKQDQLQKVIDAMDGLRASGSRQSRDSAHRAKGFWARARRRC
jgi:hypothetical protein